MRVTELLINHYYHIYNRGVDHNPVFFQRENWGFFIERLRRYFREEWVDIIAYCLMPNHYHLLVYLKIADFGARIMQPFTVSYTKAINRQQKRVGSLFQGPFQNRLVNRDEYLLHLSRYIHLNPVHAGLVARPEDWIFSSYRDYIGLRQGSLPKPEIILGQFSSPVAYADFVAAYMEEDRRRIRHLLPD